MRFRPHQAMLPHLLPENQELAKNFLHMQSIRIASVLMALSSRSTARPYPMNSLRVKSLATREEHLPAPGTGVSLANSNWRTRGPFF